MSGKYDLDRDLALRGLETLRESGRPLCKHDWVGDDDCVYCRNEELENQLMTDMMKKLELDELNEKIKKLERQIDVEQMEQAEHLAQKDAEISKLKADIQCMCDKREMGAKLAEKIERLKLEILNGR